MTQLVLWFFQALNEKNRLYDLQEDFLTASSGPSYVLVVVRHCALLIPGLTGSVWAASGATKLVSATLYTRWTRKRGKVHVHVEQCQPEQKVWVNN